MSLRQQFYVICIFFAIVVITKINAYDFFHADFIGVSNEPLEEHIFHRPLKFSHKNVHVPLPSFCYVGPSALPEHFYDTFKRTSGVRQWVGGSTCSDYQNSFEQKVRHSSSYDQRQEYERAAMRQWSEYYYAGYREFIKTLSVYDDYIFEIAEQLEKDHGFAYMVNNVEPRACDYIQQEQVRIYKKRRLIEEQRVCLLRAACDFERNACAQRLCAEQAVDLDRVAHHWEHNNGTRYDAYKDTLHNSGLTQSATYTLSSQAESALKNKNINPECYKKLQGNALQHELMREIIDGIEKVTYIQESFLHSEFNAMMYDTSIAAFNGARDLNEMGDCLNASYLIDMGTTLLKYCNFVVEGVAQGVISCAENIGNLLVNPTELIGLMTHCALHIGIRRIMPLPVQAALYGTEFLWNQYRQQQTGGKNNWEILSNRLLEWWHSPNSPEKIRQAAHGLSYTASHIIVAKVTSKFFNTLCKVAHKELCTINNSFLPEAVVANSGSGGTNFPAPPLSSSFFNTMKDTEKVVIAPACFMLEQVSKMTCIIEHGKKIGVSSENVAIAMEKLVSQGGSIDRFGQALEKFEHVPGVVGKNSNIEKILIPKNTGNIKGAFFELESGLQAIERGEEVFGFNVKITGKACTQEFDVITKTSLIECKNWDWNDYLNNKEYFKDKVKSLRGGLGQKNPIAKEVNKKLVLHSKYPLPDVIELNDLKDYLWENGIDLIEG